VMGILVGLALLSCSSPTEPEPEVGLFAHGKVTCKDEIDLAKVSVLFMCENCSERIAYTQPRPDGTYTIKMVNPNAHKGHSIVGLADCNKPRYYQDTKTWDSFPSTPVEWNPCLK
jgi:hypothetical protein